MSQPRSNYICPYCSDCDRDCGVHAFCCVTHLQCEGVFYEDCTIYMKRKDEEKMENSTLEKVLDVASGAAKVAANLSEKKDIPKTVPLNNWSRTRKQTDDNSNKATTGSQSVIVSLDNGKKKDPKPVEKHVHTYPENRPLTAQECELDLQKAKMDYELEKQRQDHIFTMDRQQWQYKLEQDKKNERKGTIKRVIGGILIALGIGVTGYSIYADYRGHKNAPVAQKTVPTTPSAPVKADGKVE